MEDYPRLKFEMGRVFQVLKVACLDKLLEWYVHRSVPIVLQDSNDIKFIRYPWNRKSFKESIYREHEREEFQGMSLLIRSGDVVFDVGAHIGLHSVFASRLVGPGGKVYAFEPVPDIYWMLRETLVLNRCENIIPLQKAICDRVGTVAMNLFEPNYSEWNTIGHPTYVTPEKQQVSSHTTIRVPSDTLDHFVTNDAIDRIDFLKVDVEGFEKFVFEGAKHLFEEQRIRCISFEISKTPLEGAGVKPREVFKLLESYRYFVYRFDLETCAFLGPIHDSNEYWANYFSSWQDLSALNQAKKDECDNGL